MSHNIVKVLDANFTIKNENKDKAVEALHNLISENKDYKFFEYIIEKNINCLENIMQEFLWYVENDKDNNICNIYLYEENGNNNDNIFNVLAPYVEPYSFIQVLGNDGFTWKWCFNGEICGHKYNNTEITKVTFKELNVDGCGGYAESRVIFYDKLREDNIREIEKILDDIKYELNGNKFGTDIFGDDWSTDNIISEMLRRFGKYYEYDNDYIEIQFNL